MKDLLNKLELVNVRNEGFYEAEYSGATKPGRLGGHCFPNFLHNMTCFTVFFQKKVRSKTSLKYIVVNTDKHKSKPLPDLSDQVPPT